MKSRLASDFGSDALGNLHAVADRDGLALAEEATDVGRKLVVSIGHAPGRYHRFQFGRLQLRPIKLAHLCHAALVRGLGFGALGFEAGAQALRHQRLNNGRHLLSFRCNEFVPAARFADAALTQQNEQGHPDFVMPEAGKAGEARDVGRSASQGADHDAAVSSNSWASCGWIKRHRHPLHARQRTQERCRAGRRS
ncbi:hypothetical protein [Xanthobacter versatilis]|uniref:hypothetical protein n=1 Tax=Xanthobacter autotrophicus (strain ATCC BAA-1158 / Py2) TaxID=78245 RepID=UPI003726516E